MREQFYNRKALVIGYGVSGKGAEFALKACGAHVTVIDESQPQHALTRDFVSGFDLIVISPSVPLNHVIHAFANELNIELYGELELGSRLFSGKVVAVTGTNGKTTTVSLIGGILKRAGKKVTVCGNIGVSFARAAIESGAEIAVVEVSSFQLESIKTFRPDIAVMTNITADHLDRHGDLLTYAALKREIVKNQTEQDYLIVSDEIPLALLHDFYPRSDCYFTSLLHPCRGAYLQHGELFFLSESVIRRESVRLCGDHNVSNVLGSICACQLLGVDRMVIADSLADFVASEHRVQFVDRRLGKNFYNDSKGTNSGATLAACRSLSGTIALILGGKEKNCDYTELFDALPQSVTHLYAIGETAGRMQAEAQCKGRTVIVCDSLCSAVENAAKSNADNVLLSPATSSFDMFTDYKERGKAFESFVQNLV